MADLTGTSSLVSSTPTFYALKRYSLSILLPLVMASSVWVYFQRVMIPHQQNEAARENKPRGNLSDLYPRWLGARELLLHGRDPYGNEITREIQIGYYGRALDPSHPNDPRDQQAFAYPLYVVWLLAPTIGLPFWIVQRATLLLLTATTAFSVLVWLEILRWRLPFDRVVAWVLLTVSCLPAVQGLKLQQLTLLIAGLIALGTAGIGHGRLGSAGVVFAIATIKPQLVFLVVVWLGIWVIGDWRGRRRLFWSFAITMALLIGASEMILPGWTGKFRLAMSSYYRYTGGGQSLLDVVFTPLAGRTLSVILVIILVSVLWGLRRSSAGSTEFAYALSFTLATTLLVIPMFAPYNQILLLPGAMMVIRSTGLKTPNSFLMRFFVFVTELSVVWPFLGSILLIIALPFLHTFVVEKGVGVPFYSTLAMPALLYATLLILRTQLSSTATSL
jgi:hypothetical protein